MKERGFRRVRCVVCLGQAAPKHVRGCQYYAYVKDLVYQRRAPAFWRLLGLRLGLFCVPAINWRVQPRTADIV